MNSHEYITAQNCQLGDVGDYSYAFVPGSSVGVVLLDRRSRHILEHPNRITDGDKERINLLSDKKLLIPVDQNFGRENLVFPGFNGVSGISIWLHVTNWCNLNCEYCYILGKDRKHMSVDIAQKFVDKLEETVVLHSLKLVTIRFAGGEPTGNKKIIRFITEEVRNRFSGKGVKVQLVLITNGTLISREWCRFLFKNNFRVCISLDGVGNWHDKMRHFKGGEGSFSAVEQGIALCREFNLPLSILTTITEENINGVPQLSRYLIDRDLFFRYGLFRDNNGGYGNYEGFIAVAKDTLGDCYNYYAQAINNAGVRFRHQLCELHLDRKAHFRACNIGYSGVIVDHLGQIWVCQSLMKGNPIGTLFNKETLLEATWRQEILPELKTASVTDYKRCTNCKWASVCGGGCPVVNASAFGSAASGSPYCNLFKVMIPRLIYLKAWDMLNNLKEAQYGK